MKKLILIAGFIFWSSACAHSGGQDENGGHMDRSTGQYHCHATDCVLPSAPAPDGTPVESISVVSFNVQFLGNSESRDDEALAALMAPHDIVVVQELVSPPFSGTFPSGMPFNPDEQSAEFFDAMTAHGYEFILSLEDTGTNDTINKNGSATEWWVTFFRPEVVQPANDLPSGFLADDRSNHPDYERVPYAFAFRSIDETLDFVLISVHLKPNSGPTNRARRAHELASIAEYLFFEPFGLPISGLIVAIV